MADSNSKKNTREKSSRQNKGKRANVAAGADPRKTRVADSNDPAPNEDSTLCAPVEVSTSPSEAASKLEKHEVGRIEISAAASPDSAEISLREGEAPEGAAGAGAAGATLSSSSSSERYAKRGEEGGSVRHEVMTGKSTCLPKFGVFIGLQLIPMRKRWPALCGNPCALEEFWTKSPFHTLEDQHGFKRLMEAPEGDATAYVFCKGFEIGQEVTGVNNLINTLLETYGLYGELARTQVAPALANLAVPIALPVAATTTAAAAAAVAAVVAVATPPSEDSTASPNPGTLRQYDPSFVGQVKAMRNKWPDVCNNPSALENFWAGSPFRTVEQRAAFNRMMKAPKTDLTVYVAVDRFRTKHDMEPVNRLMNDVLGKPRIAPHARRTKAKVAIADATAERALVAAAPTNATAPANIVVSRQEGTAAAPLTLPREGVASADVHSIVSVVATTAITLSTGATAAAGPLILGAVAPGIALLAPAASSHELELEPVFGVRLCNSADAIAATTAPDAGNIAWHHMIATNGATTDLGLTAPAFNPPAPRDHALPTVFAASAHDLFDAPPLGLASPLIKVPSYLPATTAASVLNYAPVYEIPSAAPALATNPVSTAEELLATLDSFIALASTDIAKGSNSNGSAGNGAPSGNNATTSPTASGVVADTVVPAVKAPVRGMRGPVRCQRRDTTIDESVDVTTGDSSNTGETAAATEVAAVVVVGKVMRPRAKSAPFAEASIKGMRDI